MLTSIVASIGFIVSVTTFISGIRMVRILDKRAEAIMHRINGYTLGGIYIIIAIMSLIEKFTILALSIWIIGFLVHLLKLYLVKKKLAVRYGGYAGSLILMTWIVLIFNNLPE